MNAANATAPERSREIAMMMSKPMGYNEKLAISQGWILANDAERGLEIQRSDEANIFAGDNEAAAAVWGMAALDQFSHAAFCLRFIAESLKVKS